MKDLLRRRGFRILLVGQGVSSLGDWMGTVALMAVVLDLTGSSAAVAGVLVLRLAPAALAGPLAARLVNRYDRRTTMLAMDMSRAVIVALIPLVFALWWVYLWAFVLELASIVFLPARDASIPDLAGEDQLPAANSLVLASSYGCIPLGAALFGLIAALGTGHGFGARLELAPVFWVDAATFVFSWAAIRRLELPPVVHPRRPGPASEATNFREALRLPLVRAVLPATVGASLGIGVLFSLGIVFVRRTLGASDVQFGILVALFGVGAIVGLGLLRWSGTSSMHALRFAVAVQGITIGVMSLSPSVEIAYLGAVAFGAGAAAALAAGMSVLQSRLQGEDRVLAFAVFHVVIRAGLSVAAIGAGLAADLIRGVQWPLVGHLAPTWVVLLCAGALVFLSAASFGRVRPHTAAAGGAIEPRRDPGLGTDRAAS